MLESNVKERILDYLKEAKLMSLATSKNNKPWSCNAWFVVDDKWNIYFISRKGRRHSIELKENPHVAGTIVKPHVKGSGEKVQGVQFEGTCAECPKDVILKIYNLYKQKFPLAENIPENILLDPEAIFTYYQIKPSSIVLFDEINFPNEPRQELILKQF